MSPARGSIASSSAARPPQRRLNGGTKGSHLIVDPFPGAPKDVVYYELKTDGRLVLVIPWMGRYMIGTTDIRFDDDPDDARCSAAEMDYLLGEVNQLIPQARLTERDVLYTFSGVRPLPYAPGVVEAKIPRSHVLHDHAPDMPGLVTVVGGKLTTYRQLAEDAVDDVFRRLGAQASQMHHGPLAVPGRDVRCRRDAPSPRRPGPVAAQRRAAARSLRRPGARCARRGRG